MKFFAALSAVSALSASWAVILPRQSLTFPACSQPCLATAQTGNCNPSDDTCLCNLPSFVSSTATCIANSCTGNDLNTANQAAEQLCLAVGVTLTTSDFSVSATNTPASTGSQATTTSSPSPTTSPNSALSHSVNVFAIAFGVVAAVAL
ncbi:hypothetical protein BDP27DRAFT_1309926 [Rhodocollybia butyracea]|uniref:CFEM domain-containing protein n=1 Tax=Rhodocollybia butyracea TaxID=206335 RepID=A0A9P5QB47_9AGAR|nr:hypothetical protein BDP27DRAFT_1309926 [Rhodocollybia butyracea]